MSYETDFQPGVEEENNILREQVDQLRESLSGVIREKGRIITDFSGVRHVEINDSSILSRLISEAGRWCERFASDLFIEWKYSVDLKKVNGTMKNDTVVFAFRENGVDSKTAYEARKEWPGEYYRAVWLLDIIVEENTVEMILKKGEKR